MLCLPMEGVPFPIGHTKTNLKNEWSHVAVPINFSGDSSN